MDEMVVIEATVAEPLVEMEKRIAELEARVAELIAMSASAAGGSAAVAASAGSASNEPGRKTVKTFASPVHAKGEAIAAGTLDAAFASLSVEQRIAVKMEMMRGGLLA